MAADLTVVIPNRNSPFTTRTIQDVLEKAVTNVDGINWSAEYWMNNRWEGRIHDIAWLIDEKFPGMPTWPDNWKQVYYQHG